MEKLELRARARAAARAAGWFDVALPARNEERGEGRGRAGADRRRRSSPAFIPVDEAQARAACAPMGDLEYVVQAADAKGRVRALYVIVPDVAMKSHYERIGFTLEPGCRVLLDAAALLPIALLRLSPARASAPKPGPPAAGFNPFFDLPAA